MHALVQLPELSNGFGGAVSNGFGVAGGWTMNEWEGR